MTATGRHRRRLQVALAITLVVLVVELVGAALSGSLALLADAGHMLTDAAGIGLALLGALRRRAPGDAAAHVRLPARRDPGRGAPTRSAAAGVAGCVLVEAVRRWDDPAPVEAGLDARRSPWSAWWRTRSSLLVLRGGQARVA